MNIASKHCVPCTGATAPLSPLEQQELLKALHPDWKVVDEHHLERSFRFANFREALSFTNKVGELAEMEGHHPDIHLAWGKALVKIWTHKINDLTESDFILAAKIDNIEQFNGRVCF